MTTHLPADEIQSAGVAKRFREVECRLLFSLVREDALKKLQEPASLRSEGVPTLHRTLKY